jgi:hypothetical protein
MKMQILFLTALLAGCRINHEDLVFSGEILNAETDGSLIIEGGEKYIRIDVWFRVVDALQSKLKENDEILIEYRIMRTKPDIESLSADKDVLLNWEFHKGNVMRVFAKFIDGKYIEKIYSVQQVYIEKWNNPR